jgi:hypothetical protein
MRLTTVIRSSWFIGPKAISFIGREGEYGYAYWMRQWGFSRSEAIKGIAVVQFPRSNP